VSSCLNPDVAKNPETTDKRPGGVNRQGIMPGQSGSPSGRPKKRLLSESYEALVEQPLPEDLRVGLKLPEGAIYGDAIAMGQARAAIKSKTEAAREIGDRMEGKARRHFAPPFLAGYFFSVRWSPHFDEVAFGFLISNSFTTCCTFGTEEATFSASACWLLELTSPVSVTTPFLTSNFTLL
jgi:hypothetical protein